MTETTIRIGAGQGFYGDTPTAALDMARLGNVRYIGFDALSELTLAILQKDRQKDPALGYTRDLVPLMRRLLPIARERGIGLITNAGGLNPRGAAAALAQLAKQLGVAGLRIACVTGDALSDFQGLHHADTDASPDAIADRVVFACAYLGARPIVDALRQDAHVVITGRVADSALFLAPCVHALGWSWDDWDRLASGTVVGHLLECSGQCTGGNFSGDWQSVPEPWRIGYPLAEVRADGSAVISKPRGTGGMVTVETVSEQLFYEVQDPRRYLCPDVVADFTSVSLKHHGPDEVEVSGARGQPRPETLKAVLGYADGWMGEGRVGYCRPNALAKARRAEEILRHRVDLLGIAVEEIRAEYQGVDSLLPGAVPPPDPPEVYLRMAVRTRQRADAERFTREFPYLALNGPPGVGGYGGIVPPRELLGIWPSRIPRATVEDAVRVHVEEVAP